MPSILDDFALAVQRHPDRVAIVDGSGAQSTFAQLQARADALAQGWHARGVRRGARVILAIPLNIDFYATLAALWSLGATVVLSEPAMGIAGLRHAARVSGATAICTSGAYGLLKYALPEMWRLTHLRPVGHAVPCDRPRVQGSDIALISFTSGTTGKPKAIPRDHAFLCAQHRAIAPLLHSDAAERDLVAFPVFVLINLASGQTSVLPNWKMSRLAQVAPAALGAWVKRQRVTRALLPPALCDKLAQTGISPSLHTVFTGGGPVFPDAVAALRAAKGDLRVVCVYGSTEAEPIAHLDAAAITEGDNQKMTSGHGLLVGPPVPDVQVRLVDNEIQVAGAHVNSGYLNPAHDAENKIHEGGIIWHRTGDAGYFDDQGRLWLLGRTGSQVECAKGPTYPFPIEVAARGWAGVRHCALMPTKAGACLVIEGQTQHALVWADKARSLGIQSVKTVTSLPMDRRHASKIDRRALAKLIAD